MFYSNLKTVALAMIMTTFFASPAKADHDETKVTQKASLSKTHPSFSCLANLKAMGLTSNTKQGLRGLDTFNSFYLQLPKAKAKPKNVLLEGNFDDLKLSDKKLMAGQIAGILRNSKAEDGSVLKGDQKKGAADIQDYLENVRAGILDFEKITDEKIPVYANSQEAAQAAMLNQLSENFSKGGRQLSLFSIFAYPVVGGLIAIFHPTTTTVLLEAFLISINWVNFHSLSIPAYSETNEMLDFINKAETFLKDPSNEHRVLYFSHTYEILADTFNRAENGTEFNQRSLDQETDPIRNARIPSPPKLRDMLRGEFSIPKYKTRKVTITIQIDSGGDHFSEKTMNAVIQVSK